MSHAAMRLSLEGLSIGDAFGERFFVRDPLGLIAARQLPQGEWRWTDDTHMALSIVEGLHQHGRIDQDALMRRFSWRFVAEPRYGYGPGTRHLLEQVAAGEDWRGLVGNIFPGGSFGNGAAMRVAPLGAYFAGDPARAAAEARLSAEVTHTHPEGIAGAVAVAAAAALAAQLNGPRGAAFLQAVLPHVPPGQTQAGLRAALALDPDTPVQTVADQLGNGTQVSAQDTVPFCLWCAAHHLDDFEAALWTTVAGLGDRDTTCAIVGGLVAPAVGRVPPLWQQRREPLPRSFEQALARSA